MDNIELSTIPFNDDILVETQNMKIQKKLLVQGKQTAVVVALLLLLVVVEVFFISIIFRLRRNRSRGDTHKPPPLPSLSPLPPSLPEVGITVSLPSRRRYLHLCCLGRRGDERLVVIMVRCLSLSPAIHRR